MGGNNKSVGNVTKCAEFNFWYDPEAAKVVLNEAKSPIYILPWETCLSVSASLPLDTWRFGVLNSVANDITNMMDKIERKVPYKDIFKPCDAILVGCLAFPSMIRKMKHQHVSVELRGQETRGQMTIDHRGVEKPNAHVIEDVDGEFFKKMLMWAAGHNVEI
jgi:inosine-uridine nucleoside N-ribohydrolase